MRRRLPTALVLSLAAAGAGCAPTKPSEPASMLGGSELSANWPFWPTSMRIHPLTRVITDETTGHFYIEARVEFFDSQGVTSKAVGHLTLQLLENAGTLFNPDVAELWNQDLRDPVVNQRQFDLVTRTYLFRLEADPAEFPSQPTLHAYFLSVDGQKMEATMKLKR